MKKLSFFLLALFVAGNAIAQCAASFSQVASPHGRYALEHTFNNLSTSGAAFVGKTVTTTLQFGDGQMYSTSGTWSTVKHNYPATGTYLARLSIYVVDSVNATLVCMDSTSKLVTVAYSPCSFTVNATPLNDSTFAFAATSLAGTTGLSYTWNFGDGSTGTGAAPTHVYANGFYTVNVTATGSGCTDTGSTYASVTRLAPFSCASVVKGINVTAVRGLATVNAYANANPLYRGLNKSFQYSYGDGSGVTTSNQHMYSAVGRYQVKAILTFSDSLTAAMLCRDTMYDSVTISSIHSDIYGNVFYDSLAFTGSITGSKMYLIKHDTAAGTLQAVDSTLTFGSGSWTYYQFLNVPAGRYLVKAVPLSTSTSGTGLVPTYADSALLWSAARSIYHNGVLNSSGIVVRLKLGTITGGPGFIGGAVSLGANKGAAAGAPGVSMILRDMTGKLIAMVETDALGKYMFSNVPAGTYSVLPELLNYNSMQSAPVSVSASSTTVSSLNFTKDDQKMNIRSSTLGLGKASMPLVSIAPVPAHDFIRITPGKDITAATSLEIRDLSGKVMLQSAILPGNVLNLDIRSLPAGMYFVQPGAGAPLKLVVQ